MPSTLLAELAEDPAALPCGSNYHEAIDALTQSGILWTRRSQPKRALVILDMAVLLYSRACGLLPGQTGLFDGGERGKEDSTTADADAQHQSTPRTRGALGRFDHPSRQRTSPISMR